MDTSTKEELFRKVWAALYEEGNKDELQVQEVVDQMYMAVKEPELDIEEVFDMYVCRMPLCCLWHLEKKLR